MRCTYIGLAAALCWTGVSGSLLDKVHIGGHRILADVGNHRKNASSVSLSKARGGSSYAALELRQAAGRCGQQGGRCPGDQCCSDYGFCGDTVDHCAPLFGCQPQYGVCGWPRTAPQPPTTSAPPPPPPTTTTSAPPPPPTTTSAPPPTTTSAPPPPPTTTSAPPPPPTTTALPPSTVATSTGPSPTGLRVTTNGQCGNGTICIGSTQYGPCCSQFFWCGSSMDFCGAGCKSEFGACFGAVAPPAPPASNVTSVAPPTTAAPPTSAPPVISTTVVQLTSTTAAPPTTSAPPPPPSTTSVAQPATTAVQLPPGQRSSTDGKCGSGVSCLGSTFGRCCSQFGYCGDGDQFCPPIVGCQPEFGYCDPGRP